LLEIKKESGQKGSGNSSLAKTCLLRKSKEFQKVYRRGKRLRGNNYTLIYLAGNQRTSRLGISVHGVKTAVRRNRIKRIIREFFRLRRTFISPPVDIVFAVRRNFSLNSPAEIAKSVANILRLQK
jgi:ribonuclease P protein component